MKKTAIFAAKTALIASLVLASPVTARASGIPVLDAANLSQAFMEVMEAIQQGMTQVQQYTTQLEQYEQEVMNSLAPAAFVWDTANRYVNKSMDLVDTVEYYANNSGGLDRYLAKYQTPGYYRSSPCFSVQGCTEAERQELTKADDFQAEVTKRSLDNQVKMLDEQSRQMRSDSQNLESIQRAAQGSQGRMEAAQAGNQLAANTANQMLAIRGLLLAQQQAEAARNLQTADQEARQAAADAALRSGAFVASPVKAY
jgi:P-type conjugative transfer protein TrbJ